jgi:hypothetical protein
MPARTRIKDESTEASDGASEDVKIDAEFEVLRFFLGDNGAKSVRSIEYNIEHCAAGIDDRR